MSSTLRPTTAGPGKPADRVRVLARWAAVWLAMLLPGWVAAQQPAWRSWTARDGLAELSVTALARDADGFLWVATESGLFLLDGQRAGRVHGLPTAAERSIHGLLADPRGGLWAGTGAGLYHTSQRRGTWVQVLPASGNSLAIPRGQEIADDGQGGLIALSGHQPWRVTRSSDDRFAVSLLELPAGVKLADAGILRQRNGTLWLACGRGLCRWDGRAWQVLDASAGIPPGPWLTLAEAGDGTIWARAVDRLLRWPAGSAQPQVLALPGPSRRVMYLSEPLLADRQGGVLTSIDDGLARWEDGRWQIIGQAQGLGYAGGVTALWQDDGGSMWVGTAGNGLQQWRGYPGTTVWAQLPGNEAWAFLRDRSGRLHIGTGAGLGTLDAELKLKRRPASRELPDQQVSAIAEDARGGLWYGSFSGELRLREPGKPTDQVVARVRGSIYALKFDRQGTLWVATGYGVLRLPNPRGGVPGGQTVPGLAQPQPAAADFYTLCEAGDGAIWAGSPAGLWRYAAEHWQAIHPLATGSAASEDMPAGQVACEPAGDGIWVGDADSGRVLRVSRSPAGGWQAEDHTPGALADRQLYSLLLDRQGELWVATSQGLLHRQAGRWLSWRDTDGLVSDDCNQSALYEDTDGSLWVGSSQGATHLPPPARWAEPSPPVLASVRLGESRLAPGPTLRIGESGNPLVFELEQPNLRGNPDLLLRYQLQGLEDAPHSTASRELRYASLPPGDYVLQAWSEWADTGQRSPPRQWKIEVLPRWWRTTWAAAAGGLLLLLAWWGLDRWRSRRLRHRQAELEALVSERTRELQASRDAMRELALRDALTGLRNRRAVTELLSAEVERCRRGRLPLTVVLCDADHFKRINDDFGHPAGDAVLREIAQRLQAGLRAYDGVGRYGGEEFLIVLPDFDAWRLADGQRLEAIRQAIDGPPVTLPGGSSVSVTCSFGAATLRPGQAEEPDALIAAADRALYAAKAAGRNRIELAPHA
jgi:diguanylate cyclase (GGDEF)-like protein